MYPISCVFFAILVQVCLKVHDSAEISIGLLSSGISSSTSYIACSIFLSSGISICASYVTSM